MIRTGKRRRSECEPLVPIHPRYGDPVNTIDRQEEVTGILAHRQVTTGLPSSDVDDDAAVEDGCLCRRGAGSVVWYICNATPPVPRVGIFQKEEGLAQSVTQRNPVERHAEIVSQIAPDDPRVAHHGLA